MSPIAHERSVWRRSYQIRLTLLLLAWLVPGTALAQSLPADVRRAVIPAVVQVIPIDDETLQGVGWSGSGTIISPDGYILTNFHVVGDLETRQAFHWHAISVTSALEFADQPPRHMYWAEYVAGDPTHDLALLKITQHADETPVPADLTFPAVAIGDSNAILLGDPLTIIGYPGISGDTITLTAGIMSGWLGEDWTAGGKQWIKTDAKIAHGNSGGAVFNSRGELVGVPTAGQTVQHAVLDVEEQAYVRPIGLAWALIGPNVANVRRGGAGSQVGQPRPQPEPQPLPEPQPPGQAQAQGAGEPSGSYGVLVSGQGVDRTLAAAPNPAQGVPTYHRYQLMVPAGAGAVLITVDSGSADVDLTVKTGTPPNDSWSDVDHADLETTPSPSYRLASPPAGPIFIDVINLFDTPALYGITVTVEGGEAQAGNPLAPQGDDPPAPEGNGNPLAPGENSQAAATTAPLEVGAASQGIVGALTLGQQARGTLAGDDRGVTYHTFTVDVPAGTPSLTLTMQADIDLDLAVKMGSEIESYADDGDWLQRDITTSQSATLRFDSPAPGRWYVDVFNVLGSGTSGTYTLEVR